MLVPVPMFFSTCLPLRFKARQEEEPNSSKNHKDLDATSVTSGSTWGDEDQELPVVPFVSISIHDHEEILSVHEEEDDELPELWWGMDTLEMGYYVDTPDDLDFLEESPEEGVAAETDDSDESVSSPVPQEIVIPTVADADLEEQTWIFDVSEILYQGRLPLPPNDPLQMAADRLENIMRQHMLDFSGALEACEIIRRYPDLASVEFSVEGLAPGSRIRCPPLFVFCATGCVPGIETAYQAYPEAICRQLEGLGSPLHVACRNHRPQAVSRLLQLHPSAIRWTNDLHQTPLHMACHPFDHSYMNLDDEESIIEMIEKVYQAFPTAAQLADQKGRSPLDVACQATSTSLPLLQLFGPISASWKTLHWAASHGNTHAVRFLLEQQPEWAQVQDGNGDMAMHQAVHALTVPMDTIEALLDVHPDAKYTRNNDGMLPLDLAKQLGTCSPVVLAALE